MWMYKALLLATVEKFAQQTENLKGKAPKKTKQAMLELTWIFPLFFLLYGLALFQFVFSHPWKNAILRENRSIWRHVSFWCHNQSDVIRSVMLVLFVDHSENWSPSIHRFYVHITEQNCTNTARISYKWPFFFCQASWCQSPFFRVSGRSSSKDWKT